MSMMADASAITSIVCFKTNSGEHSLIMILLRSLSPKLRSVAGSDHQNWVQQRRTSVQKPTKIAFDIRFFEQLGTQRDHFDHRLISSLSLLPRSEYQSIRLHNSQILGMVALDSVSALQLSEETVCKSHRLSNRVLPGSATSSPASS